MHPYRGRRLALLTQHGKEGAIAPVLAAAVGCRVDRLAGYDTDALGTFTREIARAGSQLEAARRKAHLAVELSGLPLGLGSEGSFGPDPMSAMLPWNLELLVFIDAERGLEIAGAAQGPALHAHLLTGDWSAAAAFARSADFPAHRLVLRPQQPDDARIRKDIAGWSELALAFAQARAQADNGLVFLESDLRAHANPTRMRTIARAAADLGQRLASLCPACGTPGFWVVERVPGLPCADCGAPTREPRAEVFACLQCAHRLTRPRDDASTADPARCDRCNP